MPKISDLDYVSEIDATSYLLGIKGGEAVRFPASVLQGETPVVNNTFIGLGDTPNSYTGQTGKLAAVNTAEDALEFINAPAQDFIGLTDTPDTYSNAGGNLLRVKTNETGIEMANMTGVPSGGVSGQVLAKNSGTDFDIGWVNQSGGSGSANDLTLVSGIYAHKNYGGF